MGDTVIVITGASEGIGYECAKAVLDRTNASVLVTSRHAEKLQRAREGLPSPQRNRLRTQVCDQGDPRALAELLTILAAPDEPLEGAILAGGVDALYRARTCRLHG